MDRSMDYIHGYTEHISIGISMEISGICAWLYPWIYPCINKLVMFAVAMHNIEAMRELLHGQMQPVENKIVCPDAKHRIQVGMGI